MLKDVISEQDLTKYNAAAKICGIVFKEIVSKITSGEILETRLLNEYGDNRIMEECTKIYKRELVKGIAFPTCISLNNCVGNFIYETGSAEFNTIKTGDVVKIELGVNLGGCISVLGETIVYNEIDNKKYSKYFDLLGDLQKSIVSLMIPGNLNDDVRIIIESKCTETGCFPVENTISYQHLDGQLDSWESKYILTNYKKHYDIDDNLLVPENICFEFESGDVFTIDLKIIPNDYDEFDEATHKYIQPHEPHVYRFNDQYQNLRLKMSREFCSMAKAKHGTNAFNCISYKSDARSRLGIKDCVTNGILESYPVLYSKDKYPVFHKKFTIVVGDEKCHVLRYGF